MIKPQLINGGIARDHRGSITFNNNLDLTAIKRMYFIHNENTDFKRGWQGHRIEQRWFTAIQGSFKVDLVHLDSFNAKNDYHYSFVLESDNSQTLWIPAGYMSCIKANTVENKLLIFADYKLGEIEDEYRFDLGHFDLF